jgi:hypothetical protein
MRLGREVNHLHPVTRLMKCLSNYLYSATSILALGHTQPPAKWLLGVKRPGREANTSNLVPESRIVELDFLPLRPHDN